MRKRRERINHRRVIAQLDTIDDAGIAAARDRDAHARASAESFGRGGRGDPRRGDRVDLE
jgi:hypothetical protein